MRDFIARALDAGSEGLHSDTHALARSLYVQATGRDDYDIAVGEARSAFLANPSRFGRQGASKRTSANFEALKANHETLKKKPHHTLALVATMLAYGEWWEHGHNNHFTRNENDKRPWMLPAVLEWAPQLRGFYENLHITI